MEKLPIPTFIINLERRIDRRKYIEKEFAKKTEFIINIVKAIEHDISSVGLYLTLKLLINKAHDIGYEFILICEDDHQFTAAYDKDEFIKNIYDMNDAGADVYLGGVSWFDYMIENNNQKYLLNSFTGTQFMVIYSRFYTSLINADFENNDTIDRWIGRLSENIYMSVPMISIQKDFGYSDVTEKNNSPGIVQQLFTDTIKRLEALEIIYKHINLTKKINILSELECNEIQIPTYLIELRPNHLRTSHIINQFTSKEEFEIIEVFDFKTKDGNYDKLSCFQKIIEMSLEREDEVIIICDDDHVFCEKYEKTILLSSIYQGAYLGADIILGGISDTRQVVEVNDYLFWIDSFTNSSFIIIYKPFFNLIVGSNLMQADLCYHLLSELTFNKYVIHPFISLNNNSIDSNNSELDVASGIDITNICNLRLNKFRRKKWGV